MRALPGPAPVVEIVDLRVPFHVVVSGRVRAYRDEARDCTQRARVAAVFVALTIDPAFIAAATPAPPAAPPPPVVVSQAAIIDIANQRTAPTPWIEWNACSIGENLTPGTAVLYVDDCAVSRSRVGPNGIIAD